jgi:hypothetical protein
MEGGHGRGQQNQREFRYANERLSNVLTHPNAGLDGRLIPFFCECADRACLGRITITADRYEGIHLDDRDYVILPGHLRISGEEILEENGYYEVVQKAA